MKQIRFWEKPRKPRFRIWASVRFFCRSLLASKKRVSYLSCVHFESILVDSSKCSVFLKRMFIKHAFEKYSVRNVKNVKASWEWLKYWLYVWNKFGFEKNRGNRNFGFDLLASVQFGSGFYKPKPNRNSVSAHPYLLPSTTPNSINLTALIWVLLLLTNITYILPTTLSLYWL